MKKIVVALGCLLLPIGAGAVSAARQDALPPAVLEGLTQQLAERLMAITPVKTPADRDAVIVSARAQVQKLHTGLRAWGEKGIVARAPEFSQLALPSSGHRLLDAMSRYQVCTILLTTQLAGERDVPAKRAAAVALIGVTMAMVSLVPTLTTNGLTEGEIRAFMVGDRMSRATEGVLKGDVDVRAHVEAKCRPAVTSLIGLIG